MAIRTRIIRTYGPPIVANRNTLVVGVDKPTRDTTGTLDGVALSTVSGNVTLSTAGQTYQNQDVFGRITVTAANVSIKNCRVRGLTSGAPADGSALIVATGAGVSNLLIEDCTLVPDMPHWNWDSAIAGHDFTARRCYISQVTDGINVYNSPLYNGGAVPVYASNVTIEQCLIEGLAWWTAAANGTVHPNDTETHNDAIQHQGGTGTIIRGNVLDPAYALNYAHYYLTSATGVEPRTFVAQQSLPAAAPTYGGPFHAFNDRGSGTAASGRYNVGNVCALMLNANVGRTLNLSVTDNWIYGGIYGVNGGGITRGTGENLGSFLRNRFDRSQGSQSTGGNQTNTITLSTTWAGNVTSGAGTSDRNYYEDQGNTAAGEINFRGD